MSQRQLHISTTLNLPPDAVTQTFAILGIRGSGKTNTGVVMMEEMLTIGQQCVVLDPTNAWYGIRSSRDGRSDGFKVYVFGGPNGDLPLEGTHGQIMADFVVETGASVIFSLRHLSMNDQRRFAMEFGERLHHLKGKPENRTPLCLYLDEADEFVPQRIPKGYERMFGAYDRLVRRDRNCGLGVVLISQRPQVINKDTLSQIETLICHRLLHKLDRKSVKEAWVEGHDIAGKAEEFFSGLASLAKGDTWVWSPEWLDIFKQVHVRQRETFDSSATPKAGEKVKVAHQLAPVDLDKLKDRLSSTIEKAKQDDPKELKKEIAYLKGQLGKSPSATQRMVEKIVPVPVPMPEIPKAVFKYLEDLQKDIQRVSGVVSSSLGKLGESGTRTATSLQQMHDSLCARNLKRAPIPKFEPKQYGVTVNLKTGEFRNNPDGGPLPSQARSSASSSSPSNGDSNLSGIKERILKVLAEFESIGRRSVRRTVISARAEARGGYFTNTVGNMRSEGLIDYPSAGLIAMTDKGRSIAAVPESPIDNAGMYESYMRNLSGLEQRIFSHLYKKYPEAMSRDALSEAVQARGGYFTNTIGHMRSMEFVEYPSSGMVRCPDWVFVE